MLRTTVSGAYTFVLVTIVAILLVTDSTAPALPARALIGVAGCATAWATLAPVIATLADGYTDARWMLRAFMMLLWAGHIAILSFPYT